MDYIKVSKKLNEKASILNLNDKIEFLECLNYTKLSSFIGKVVPFAKVAVFFTENSYISYAVPLCESLKMAKLKPISVVLDKEKRLSVDNVKGLFNISEEVRYLIVTDSVLAECALYFATAMNIPVLFIVSDYNFKGITANEIEIDNANNVDNFKTNAKRVIVFDEKSIAKSNVSKAIASIGGKIIALIDYKINSAVMGLSENAIAIEMIEDAIDNFLSVSANDKNAIRLNALYYSFLVELLRLSSDNIYACSSALATAKLAENTTLESVEGEFFSAKTLLDRYASAFCEKNYGKYVSDYNCIAQNLCEHTKQSFSAVCSCILHKVNIFNQYSGGVKRLCSLLSKTVLRAKNEIKQMDKLYKANGGKKTYMPKSIIECANLSGYVGKTVNGMTLLSELGFINI